MKHTISLLLAVMMIFSMASVCLADDDVLYPIHEIWEEGFLLDEDDRYVDFDEPWDETVPYGETVYFPLISIRETDSGEEYVAVHETDAAKKVKIKTDWDEGKSYIDKLSVVRKRFVNHDSENVDDIDFSESRYAYFLTITTQTRSKSTTSSHEVNGEIFLRKSGSDGFDYEDGRELYVNFEVGYFEPDEANTIPITPALFEPGDHFDEYDEETFDFEADDDSYFVVDTDNQKKIVLGMDCDYDDDIGERFPNADLYFFNGNGAKFNRIGYLYLYTGDDDYRYAYSIDDDGELEKVNSTYDSHDECIVIRTRTLGRYVISNVKLNVTDNTDNYDNTEVIFDNNTQINYNPGTGGGPWMPPSYIGWSTQPAIEHPAAPTLPAAPSSAPAKSEAAPAPMAEEAEPEKKAEEKPEKADDAVVKTAVKVEEKRPTFATMIIGSEDGDITLDNGMMLMIACIVGVVASVIGLIFCIAAIASKKRGRYY